MRSLMLAGGLIVVLAACTAPVPTPTATRSAATLPATVTPAPGATPATATSTAVPAVTPTASPVLMATPAPTVTPTLTATADPTAVAGAALARQFERALTNHSSEDLAPYIPESGITIGVYRSDAGPATREQVLALLAELSQKAQAVEVRYAPEVQLLRPGNSCLNPEFAGDVGLMVTLDGLTAETDPYGFYQKSLITLRQRDAMSWQWVAWIWRPYDPIEPECWGTPTPMRPEHVPSPLPAVGWLTGR